jgi:hypothetical protein
MRWQPRSLICSDAAPSGCLSTLGSITGRGWRGIPFGPVWLPSELTALSVTTVSLVHAALGEQLASVIAACVNCYASIVAEFPTPEIVV